MIEYKIARLTDIDLLVELRIKELAMFSDIPLSDEAIKQVEKFYHNKMKNNVCYTILAYDKECLVSTGSVYFYDSLPSNANPMGVTGYITNIWTHDNYRRQKLASNIMEQLIEYARSRCGLLCLNSSLEAINLYKSKGFVLSDRNMTLKL